MFSHAVADAAFAGLNRAAQCFHIIPARLVKRAWFSHAETWNKNKNGNSCDGPSAHDVISVTAHIIVLEIYASVGKAIKIAAERHYIPVISILRHQDEVRACCHAITSFGLL